MRSTFVRLARSAVALPSASLAVASTALGLSVWGQNPLADAGDVLASHPQAIWLVLVAVLVHALVQLVQGYRGRREREGRQEHEKVLREMREHFELLRDALQRYEDRRDNLTRNAINEVVERLRQDLR